MQISHIGSIQRGTADAKTVYSTGMLTDGVCHQDSLRDPPTLQSITRTWVLNEGDMSMFRKALNLL